MQDHPYRNVCGVRQDASASLVKLRFDMFPPLDGDAAKQEHVPLGLPYSRQGLPHQRIAFLCNFVCPESIFIVCGLCKICSCADFVVQGGMGCLRAVLACKQPCLPRALRPCLMPQCPMVRSSWKVSSMSHLSHALYTPCACLSDFQLCTAQQDACISRLTKSCRVMCRLQAQMAQLEVVFLSRFVFELLRYINLLLRLRPEPLSEADDESSPDALHGKESPEAGKQKQSVAQVSLAELFIAANIVFGNLTSSDLKRQHCMHASVCVLHYHKMTVTFRRHLHAPGTVSKAATKACVFARDGRKLFLLGCCFCMISYLPASYITPPPPHVTSSQDKICHWTAKENVSLTDIRAMTFSWSKLRFSKAAGSCACAGWKATERSPLRAAHGPAHGRPYHHHAEAIRQQGQRESGSGVHSSGQPSGLAHRRKPYRPRGKISTFFAGRGVAKLVAHLHFFVGGDFTRLQAQAKASRLCFT